MVIVFTGEPSTSGGLHTEFGMALALKKRLILVGPRENVFHTLPEVEYYARLAVAGDGAGALTGRRRRREGP